MSNELLNNVSCHGSFKRKESRKRTRKKKSKKKDQKKDQDKIIRKLYLKDCFDIKLKYAMNVFIHCAVEA